MDRERGFTCLPAAALERLRDLEWIARELVEGALAGLHRSPYRGFSAEFADHRKYTPGDSLRHLDWNVLARSGKYYLKQFEEESNLVSLVAIDRSASMAMPDAAGLPVKFRHACCLAAAFLYLMNRQRDAAGLFVYDAVLSAALPPRLGLPELRRKLSTLETLVPGGQTRTGPCLLEIAERAPRRSLVVAFSDFLGVDESFARALRLLRFKRCEAVFFRLESPDEADFPYEGRLEIEDLETGERLETEAGAAREGYLARRAEYFRSLRAECETLRFPMETVSTRTPFEYALAAYFAKRELLF